MHVLCFGNKLNKEVCRGFIFANLFNSLYLLVRLWWNILVTNLATNFQDLVTKVKNLVALAPVLGAISRPVNGKGCNEINHSHWGSPDHNIASCVLWCPLLPLAVQTQRMLHSLSVETQKIYQKEVVDCSCYHGNKTGGNLDRCQYFSTSIFEIWWDVLSSSCWDFCFLPYLTLSQPRSH